MAATPNTFDYFIASEPEKALAGKSSSTSFDYFIGSEPIASLTVVAAVATPHMLMLVGVGS